MIMTIVIMIINEINDNDTKIGYGTPDLSSIQTISKECESSFELMVCMVTCASLFPNIYEPTLCKPYLHTAPLHSS